MEVADFRAVDFSSVYDNLASQPAYGERPYTVVNAVSSLDGKAALDGLSGKLGSEADHLLMRKIRSACDALVYGTGTLRAENVNPLVPEEMAALRLQRGAAPQPRRVILSSSGRLPTENLFFRAPGEPPVIFLANRAPKSAQAKMRRAVVFVVGEKQVDLRRAVALLRGELGVRTMVVEGGPTLIRAMLAAGLVDELFLTLAPIIVADPSAPAIVAGPQPLDPMPRLSLRSVYRDGSELYLRYNVRR